MDHLETRVPDSAGSYRPPVLRRWVNRDKQAAQILEHAVKASSVLILPGGGACA